MRTSSCAVWVAAVSLFPGWEDEDVLIVGYTEEPPRKRRKVTEEGVWILYKDIQTWGALIQAEMHNTANDEKHKEDFNIL